MHNIRLLIEYDGTNYVGWQRQNNALAIQQVIEESIKEITKEDVGVIGSSRTDTGVHAKGFVANFYTNSAIPPQKFKNALNSKLPSDIVILDSEEVSEEFHARYSSKGKTYVYTMLNRENPVAIDRNYVYHFDRKINVEKMKEACIYFIGTHDFAAFKNKGSSVKTSVRTITELKIEKDGDFINIKISADGFLYNMVRIIVGTLIDVGIEKILPQDIPNIIEKKDRTLAGKSAPAHGLCLIKVFY